MECFQLQCVLFYFVGGVMFVGYFQVVVDCVVYQVYQWVVDFFQYCFVQFGVFVVYVKMNVFVQFVVEVVYQLWEVVEY